MREIKGEKEKERHKGGEQDKQKRKGVIRQTKESKERDPIRWDRSRWKFSKFSNERVSGDCTGSSCRNKNHKTRTIYELSKSKRIFDEILSYERTFYFTRALFFDKAPLCPLSFSTDATCRFVRVVLYIPFIDWTKSQALLLDTQHRTTHLYVSCWIRLFLNAPNIIVTILSVLDSLADPCISSSLMPHSSRLLPQTPFLHPMLILSFILLSLMAYILLLFPLLLLLLLMLMLAILLSLHFLFFLLLLLVFLHLLLLLLFLPSPPPCSIL